MLDRTCAARSCKRSFGLAKPARIGLHMALALLSLCWDAVADVEVCYDKPWCRDILLPNLCGQMFDNTNVSEACPLECESCAAHSNDLFVVVIMINVAPQDFARRRAIRATLAKQYGHARITGKGDHGGELTLKMTHFFAVGTPSQRWDADSGSNMTRAQLIAGLKNESHAHKDLAHLLIEDGVQMTAKARRRCMHCLPGDSGKSHHLFAWAYRRYKNRAHVIMKQDDDTFVDWSVAAPRLFNGLELPLRRYAFGARHHKEYTDGRVCPAGALYGLSLDVAQYVVESIKPRVFFEDLEACNWLVAVENGTGGSVNRERLVPCTESSSQNYWVHGKELKQLAHYQQCANPEGCHGKCNKQFAMHTQAV